MTATNRSGEHERRRSPGANGRGTRVVHPAREEFHAAREEFRSEFRPARSDVRSLPPLPPTMCIVPSIACRARTRRRFTSHPRSRPPPPTPTARATRLRESARKTNTRASTSRLCGVREFENAREEEVDARDAVMARNAHSPTPGAKSAHLHVVRHRPGRAPRPRAGEPDDWPRASQTPRAPRRRCWPRRDRRRPRYPRRRHDHRVPSSSSGSARSAERVSVRRRGRPRRSPRRATIRRWRPRVPVARRRERR